MNSAWMLWWVLSWGTWTWNSWQNLCTIAEKNKTITIQTKLNWSTTVSHYKVVCIFSKKKVDMVYIGLKSNEAFTYKWYLSGTRRKLLKLVVWFIVPWVPEAFLAYGGKFRSWPKADTSSAVGRSRQKKPLARVTIKTWQKPETALVKSLAPGVGLLVKLHQKEFSAVRNKPWRKTPTVKKASS